MLGGEPGVVGETIQGSSPPGKKGGRAGEVYALFAQSGEVAADEVSTISEPHTKWVSVDDHTRSNGDMEVRAGKYLRDQNLLIINSDFRVFTDMVDRWHTAYAAVAGSAPVVKETVHEWFEQQLTEAVMSAHALKQSGNWSLLELDQLWNEAALTAAVLPRWHIDQAIKRALCMRLGSLR